MEEQAILQKQKSFCGLTPEQKVKVSDTLPFEVLKLTCCTKAAQALLF
jgi:hypothetical protein